MNIISFNFQCKKNTFFIRNINIHLAVQAVSKNMFQGTSFLLRNVTKDPEQIS
jgi:hypothetical protein